MKPVDLNLNRREEPADEERYPRSEGGYLTVYDVDEGGIILPAAWYAARAKERAKSGK